MAQQIQTLLIDDMDGGDADETVKFALDGTAYEIDLSAANATEIRETLGKFTKHARPVRRASAPARRARGAERTSTGRDTNAIRAWLKENGYGDLVKDRGRIPAELEQRFLAGVPAEAPKAVVPHLIQWRQTEPPEAEAPARRPRGRKQTAAAAGKSA